MRVHDAAGGLLVVLEQVLDDARFLRPHQVEDGRRQLFRQVVDQRRGVVGRDLLRELGDLFGRARREQRGARLRTELGDRLHRQPAVALGQQAERRLAILVRQLAEDLGEVGGVLLLQQVQQVGGRTNAQQSLDRVEDEIDSALRRHDECPSPPLRPGSGGTRRPLSREGHKRLNVARGLGSRLQRSRCASVDGRNSTICRLMARVGSSDGEISPEIVEACRRGDREALRALYEAYKDKRLLDRLLLLSRGCRARQRRDAAGVPQTDRGHGQVPRDSAFSTWLYRIVVNACVDRSRRHRGRSRGRACGAGRVAAMRCLARGAVGASARWHGP